MDFHALSRPGDESIAHPKRGRGTYKDAETPQIARLGQVGPTKVLERSENGRSRGAIIGSAMVSTRVCPSMTSFLWQRQPRCRKIFHTARPLADDRDQNRVVTLSRPHPLNSVASRRGAAKDEVSIDAGPFLYVLQPPPASRDQDSQCRCSLQLVPRQRLRHRHIVE